MRKAISQDPGTVGATSIDLDGRRAWIAGDIGAALGYEDLATLIRTDWSGELVADVHYKVCSGDELRQLEQIGKLDLSDLFSPASSSLVLFDEGLFLVALKTDDELRARWRAVLSVMSATDTAGEPAELPAVSADAGAPTKPPGMATEAERALPREEEPPAMIADAPAEPQKIIEDPERTPRRAEMPAVSATAEPAPSRAEQPAMSVDEVLVRLREAEVLETQEARLSREHQLDALRWAYDRSKEPHVRAMIVERVINVVGYLVPKPQPSRAATSPRPEGRQRVRRVAASASGRP